MTQVDHPVCLITRPRPEAERFGAKVTAAYGLSTLISPLIEIVPTSLSVEMDTGGAVILTSVQAARRLTELGIPKDALCFAVGARTAGAAREQGYQVVVAGGDAAALVDLILSQRPAEQLLHLRGEHSRGQICARLRAAGLECRETVVYQQVKRDCTTEAQAALKRDEPLVVPLFSPRTARLFAASNAPLRRATVVAMSAAVAGELTDMAPAALTVAEAPNEASMIAAIGETRVVRALLERSPLQS